MFAETDPLRPYLRMIDHLVNLATITDVEHKRDANEAIESTPEADDANDSEDDDAINDQQSQPKWLVPRMSRFLMRLLKRCGNTG